MKRVIITVIQILIAAGLFYWIFRDEETRRQFVETMKRVDALYLFAGVLVMWAILSLQAVRWWILVRVHEIPLSLGRASVLAFIGQFFSMFLPGGTAGDIIKIFYVTQETQDKKTAAFLSVLMDRVVGLSSLIVFVAVIIGLRWGWFMQSTEDVQRVLYFFLAFLAIIAGGLGFSFVITGLGLVEKLPDWFPLRSKFIDLAAAYHAYAKAWPSTLLAGAVSIVSHTLFCLIYLVGAYAIGVSFGLFDMIAIAPIVNAISAVPLTPGGAGVREGMFEQLAPLAGVDGGTAVTISLCGYIMILAGSLLGGVFFAFYRASGKGRIKVSEMRESLEELEEKAEAQEIDHDHEHEQENRDSSR